MPSLALQLQRGKKTRRRRTPRDGPTPEMEAVMWHKFKAGIFTELTRSEECPRVDYSSPFQFLPSARPPEPVSPPSPAHEEDEQPEPLVGAAPPTLTVGVGGASCLLHNLPSLDDKFPDLWKQKKTDQRAFHAWHQRLTETIVAHDSMPEGVKEYFRQRKPPPLTQRADMAAPLSHRGEGPTRFKSTDSLNPTHNSLNPLAHSAGRVTANGLVHALDDPGRRSPGMDRHFEEFKMAVEAQKLQILQEYQKLNSESDQRRSIEIRSPVPCGPHPVPAHAHAASLLGSSPTGGGSLPLPSPTSLPNSPPPPRLKSVTRTSSPSIGGGKRRSEDLRSAQDKKSRSGSNSITRSFKKTFEKSLGAMHSPRGRRSDKSPHSTTEGAGPEILRSPPRTSPTAPDDDDELLAQDEGPGLFVLSPKAKDRSFDRPAGHAGSPAPSKHGRRRGRSRRRKSVIEEGTHRVTFSRANSFGNSQGRPRSGESSDGVSSAPEPAFERLKEKSLSPPCPLDDAEEERSIEDESTND